MEQQNRLRLPARKVWERAGVVERTLNRWVTDPSLNFPQPTYVNGRRYFWLDEIKSWERDQAALRRTRRATFAGEAA
jgi:hypothetical protein